MVVASIIFAEESFVIFSSEQDIYLKKNNLLVSSSYIHFLPNGTYRRINREHLFTKEIDNGIWDQDESGLITMISNLRIRDIECAPLSVLTWHQEELEKLPDLILKIKAFLKNNIKSSFEWAEIEQIGNEEGEPAILVDMAYVMDNMPDEKIPRESLKKLIYSIGEYLKSETRNHFYCVSWNYKGGMFLMLEDSVTSLPGGMDEVKKVMDSLEGGEVPAGSMYFGIKKAAFEKEVKTTQPFIFYPELNDDSQHKPE
jgi:hypothetical protein